MHSCLDTGYANLTAQWAWFWVLRVGHAETWLGCALEKWILRKDSQADPGFS